MARRETSPQRDRQQLQRDANLGVPEHDVVSLAIAQERERSLGRANSSADAARDGLGRDEAQERRRVAALLAALESSSDDGSNHDGLDDLDISRDGGNATEVSAGARRSSRLQSKLRQAAVTSDSLRAHVASRDAVDEAWVAYSESGALLTDEDRRVLYGRDAVRREREHRGRAEASAGLSTRSRALEYSLSVSRNHSPSPSRDRANASADPDAWKVSHPTAWVSRASGKPPPPPREKVAPDASLRAANHQPPLDAVSGVAGFGDGIVIERVDIADDVGTAARRFAVEPVDETGIEHEASEDVDETHHDGGVVVTVTSRDSARGMNAPQYFRAWCVRIVQLLGTMQVVDASKEARDCIDCLEAAAIGAFPGGDFERHALLAVAYNNAGMVHSRAKRPVAALEAFEASLAADELSGTPGTSPSTLLNIAAVLSNLKRFQEARSLAISVWAAAAMGDSAVPLPPTVQASSSSVSDPDPEASQMNAQALERLGGHVAAPVPPHALKLARRQVRLCDQALADASFDHAANAMRARESKSPAAKVKAMAAGQHSFETVQEQSRVRATASRMSRQTRPRPWRRHEVPSGLADISAITAASAVDASTLNRSALEPNGASRDETHTRSQTPSVDLTCLFGRRRSSAPRRANTAMGGRLAPLQKRAPHDERRNEQLPAIAYRAPPSALKR